MTGLGVMERFGDSPQGMGLGLRVGVKGQGFQVLLGVKGSISNRGQGRGLQVGLGGQGL